MTRLEGGMAGDQDVPRCAVKTLCDGLLKLSVLWDNMTEKKRRKHVLALLKESEVALDGGQNDG